MSAAPFLVFYRYQGHDYNAAFDTMRRAKQFARLTGGRIECRLVNLLDSNDKQFIADHFQYIHTGDQ
jgi:hypothetical protein